MQDIQFVADRPTVDGAAELIALFGAQAAREASARADRSRDVGNLVLFCRWRQIARLIALLALDEVVGTVH